MRPGRIARLVLVTVVVGYVALCGVLFVAQRSLVFPGAGGGGSEPRLSGATLLRIPGPTGDVVALHAPARDDAPTLVYFHGNGETIASPAAEYRALRAAGFGLFAVEYPGYGVAPGAPSEESLVAAAEVALAHLRGTLGVPNDRTVLFGHSLGTGVAAAMAARGHGARVVLVAPYTSILDMARIGFSFLPLRLLVRDPFDTMARASAIHVPALVVHGTADQVIPFRMGETVAGKLAARFVAVEGGDHYPFAEAHEVIVAFARGQ